MLVARSLAKGLADVSIAAPAVNVITFVSTDTYRRRVIAQSLEQSESAFRDGVRILDEEFDADRATSLLSVYSNVTVQLAGLLESGTDSGISVHNAEERNLVANAYRVVARNRDFIYYVSSHQIELGREMVSAYAGLIAAFKSGEDALDRVDECSNTVMRMDLAARSLR